MANKRKKAVVFGSSGLLGGEFFNFFLSKKFSVYGYDSKSCDITEFNQVSKIIKKIKPDIVVNCAAKISIVGCDSDPLGAYLVNSIGPGNIARALRLSDKKSIFFQMSTSYVFGGKTSGVCRENSEVRPANVYGWSKYLGEKIIEQELGNNNLINYYIIRTGWLYGGFRKTFIDEIAGSLMMGKPMKLVSDNHNIPTWTRDLVESAFALSGNKNAESGIYHLLDSYKKPVSKYDIGIFIADSLGISSRNLESCLYSDVSKVGRMGNDILVNSKTKPMPDWKKSLARYLRIRYGKSSGLK